MRLSRGLRVALVLTAGWFLLGSWISHRARASEVEDYERSVVYVCVHWSDGLPLMPRQSPEKCYRKHVVGNAVRQRFIESGWGEDAAVALLQLAGIWCVGLVVALLVRLRRRPARAEA